MSLKGKVFRGFVKNAMKKYVGKEQEYITQNMPGRTFKEGQMRECKYKAPEGFKFEREIINSVNMEHLYREGKQSGKVIYMLHGGAFHMAMSDLYNGVMEGYSSGKYEVYAVDYRTAPKDPFPAALEDAVAGYEVLLGKGYEPKNIIVAGDSAGGNLALALGFKLREMGKEMPYTFVLSSPWVDLAEAYTPEQKASDISFGWGNVLETCATAYANGHDIKDPYISPIYGDFTGFKNVYISVAKGEMLESSGRKLAEKMREAGANVIFDELDSGMHAVITMRSLNIKEVTDAWIKVNSYIHVVING